MKYGVYKIGNDICLCVYDIYEQALERLKGFENDLEVREIEDETKVRLW